MMIGLLSRQARRLAEGAYMGHRDPKSTEVYLHVSNKTLLGIRSPFDEMGGE